MTKAVLSVCVSLWLVFGLAGSVRAAPVHLPLPVTGGGVVLVADGSLGSVNEIFEMDPPHLLFLGGGIVAGAVLVAPALGIGELLGVAVGVIGSEFLYQTTYRRSRWF